MCSERADASVPPASHAPPRNRMTPTTRPEETTHMEAGQGRQALVVRGGWEGHSPIEATDRFIPLLKEHGFAVEVHDGPEVYADTDRLAATDLVVQCYTQGVATDEQVLGLSRAVAAGTGLAGWHGGVCDSYRGSPD